VLSYRFFMVPGVPSESESAPAEQTPGLVLEKPMTVAEKKLRFRELLVPAVDSVYRRLHEQYKRTARLLASNKGAPTIAALKKRYRAGSDTELLAALKPHPRSVALAQAALESSWGTSRFFNEANNVFGVWSFNTGEPRIAATGRRGSKTIWLKKYATIEASVEDYYRVLALGRAYRAFRAQRLRSDNPYELLTKLDSYSEKGAAYGRELSSVLSYNKFSKYDETFYPVQSAVLIDARAATLAANRAELAAAASLALENMYSVVSYVDLARLAQPHAATKIAALSVADVVGAHDDGAIGTGDEVLHDRPGVTAVPGAAAAGSPKGL